MSKHIKYIRVSTEEQGYEQQDLTISRYLENIKCDELVEVKEKVSGTIDFNDRKLKSVLDIAEEGDVIVVSELSRIARSMTNLFEFVGKCQDKGVVIIQAKDNTIIPADKDNISSKIYLTVLGLAAEIEVICIRQRVQSGIDSCKERIKKDGGFIAKKSGEFRTKLGRDKGCDTSAAFEAASIARRLKKENDPRWAEARTAALRWVEQGKTFEQIAVELNALGMTTRTGGEWKYASVRRLINNN